MSFIISKYQLSLEQTEKFLMKTETFEIVLEIYIKIFYG